jgi:protoporphyrinogen oxidase
MGLKIGIIGGGVMGLTLAYRFSSMGHQVQIIETREQIGGLSTWFDYGDFVWDKYYHVILRQDRELLDLIEELQIDQNLRWHRTQTGFLWNKQLISMSNYWEFLQFPALNLLEKLRLGFGILYSNYLQKPEKLEGITAKEWLISIFGKSVFNTIWEPLLESKFGVLKDRIPAFMLWATINRYYGTRSKSDGKELMGYLSGGGLKIFLKALEQKILERQGTIHCGEMVKELIDGHPHAIGMKTNKGYYEFDRVVSTIPSVIFNQLISSRQSKMNSAKKPEFLGVIRLALILDKSISPYYVTNLIDKNLPFTGIIELSRLIEPQELGKKSLIMLPRYDIPSSDWFKLSDEEIKTRFISSLKKTWPSIEKDITRSFVHRESIVQAVWMNGSPNTEPWISNDGRFWSVNAELSGFDNLNNNAIVRVANHAAGKFIEKEKSDERESFQT